MRDREKLRQLLEITTVREVQEGAAQMQAELAERHRASAADRLEEASGVLADRQAAWSRSVEEPLISLDVMAAWSIAVVEGADTQKQMQAELASADQEASRLVAAWRRARLQSENARSLSAKTARRLSKARDEAAQTETADRTAQRSVAP